jgi:LmbE family N-acetylglucosaminyl deacetylase
MLNLELGATGRGALEVSRSARTRTKDTVSPDLILTHHGSNLHQDHRLVAELTWNTFRDHLILEYEIPKYDSDLGSPNVFTHLDENVCCRKVEALLRLRGMESRSPHGLAEAFYGRKLVL